jgi:DinB superfamily
VLIDTKSVANELSAVNSAATALCKGLTADQLAWRPHPEKWSIAENLIHLCTTTEVFLPTVDHAILESRSKKLLGQGPFPLGLYGRVLVWYVEPPPVIRLPAPKALRPQLPGSPECVLENFLALQSAMMRRLTDADGLNLVGMRFSSPLASYVRMNLLEFFSVFNGHSRRHLWQATNVRRDLQTASGPLPPLV